MPPAERLDPPAERLATAGDGAGTLAAELSAFDALDVSASVPRRLASTVATAAWPKLIAIAVVLGAWQLVVWSGWRPAYLLPPPGPVAAELGRIIGDGSLVAALAVTMRRAVTGFALAVAIGVLVGIAVSRWAILRSAIGSLVTGLQTMPSIAWFPLAILLFGLSETAILFVVVLGAAPAIANGLIGGIDHIPPILLRAGRVLGARGLAAYRHVILPAAMPAFVGGLKQAWAFAWRSLMAGELLVIIARQPSIGARLQLARDLSDADGLIAMMVVILIVGIVVDLVIFGTLERQVRTRWGLAHAA
jgi:NitT/TauT family transport system permease protein